MITDQGCQTNAPEALAFVSSCPEWFIGRDTFDGQLDDVPQEFKAFFQKMDRCQNLGEFQNSRFRCYGEVRPDNSHCMVLVIEFKEYKDNEDFWNTLDEVRNATSAHLWVMDDEYEIEHSWQSQDAAGNKIGETFGENHGRAYMQVELSWRIEKLSYSQIKSLAHCMAAATEQIWMAAGVGVC